MHSIGAQKIKLRQPRRLIKQIIRGSITIAAGSSGNTGTIPAVDTRYAAIIYNGFTTANTAAMDARLQYPRLSFSDKTTISALTNTADATYARTVYYTVIEFYPWAIRSIQTGTILLNGATSATATINSVNTSNAFVLFQGQTHSSNTGDFNYTQGRLSLTNATTVTAEKNSAFINALTIGYCVIEFNPGIVKSVQQVSATIAAGSASITGAINSVDTANSLLFFNGWNNASFATNDTRYIPRADLTDATTVTFTRIATASMTTPCRATVVEFHPIYIRQKQKGTTAIGSGATSNTSTITAVDTNKTFVTWNGFTDSANHSSNPAVTYGSIEITNGTTLTARRGSSNTDTVTVGWEATEFR